jgi:hypothetical protein
MLAGGTGWSLTNFVGTSGFTQIVVVVEMFEGRDPLQKLADLFS